MTPMFLYLLFMAVVLFMVFGVWLVLIAIRVATDLRHIVRRSPVIRLVNQARVRRRRNAYLDAYFRAHERPLR